MSIQFSTYNYEINGEEGSLLFHALSLRQIYLSNRILSVLKDHLNRCSKLTDFKNILNNHNIKNSNELVEKLLSGGFIIGPEQSANAELKNAVRQFEHLPKIDLIYIFLGFGCNLSCDYCMIGPSNNQDFNKFRIDEFSNTLDYIVSNYSNPEETLRFLFYGGEPLLYFETLKKVKTLIEKSLKKKKLEFAIVSNGTLITDEIAEWLSNNKFLVGLSIDGMPEIHDKYRKYKEGNGSYNDVKSGFFKLRSYGCEPSISCTISDCSMQSFLDNLKFIIQDFNPKSIGFNPMVTPADRKDYFGDKYSEKFAKYSYIGWKYLRDAGVYEDKCMRIIECLSDFRIRYNDCGACGNQLVVLPNGDLTICHALAKDPKYIFNKEKWSVELSNALNEWSQRSPLKMEECKDCIAIGVCGGGCPYRSLNEYHSIWEIDKQHCEFSKHVTTSFLKDVCHEKERRIKLVRNSATSKNSYET